MAQKKLDLKKSSKGLTFFTKFLPRFGSVMKAGDQSVFDRRGAITITDKLVTDKNGDRINIRGIKDAGLGTSMVITAPSSSAVINPHEAMSQYVGWTYAATKAIADAIAGIEWRLFKLKNGEQIEIEEHEVLDLLDAVNSYQTGPAFRSMLASHLELTGNAYILLEGVTDENSKPTALHLLNPGSVLVLLDKTTYPYKKVGFRFTVDGREFTYQPYQVAHIQYPNPNNPFVGIGTVQGIFEWISNDRNSSDFLNQFFKNGAQIGVTFNTDMTGEEQLHELRDSFNEQHTGVGNAYKAMFLPKGVEKVKDDVKFDDIGMDAIGDSNRDKILAGFRMPKTILGAAESDTNRATAETADFVFAKRTIKPKMLLICSYLNEFVIPRFADDLILTFTDPVPEDATTKSNEMKNATAGQPVITVNEARVEYLNKDPIEGGDALLTLNSFIPIADAGKNPMYTLAQQPKIVAQKKLNVGYLPVRMNRKKTQFAKNSELRKTMADELSSKISKIICDIKAKSVKELTDQEYDEVILKEKRERNISYATEMVKELRKLNDDQKKEVLSNLDNAIKANTSTKAINVEKLFDLDSWISLTINVLKPIATSLFAKESEQALKLIDQPGLDVENTPSAKRAINKAMNLMSESYNQDTVKLLEIKLTEGLEQGFGVQKLATLVEDIYAWKDQYAAERVALTESNRISNEAGKIAWKESGVVTEIKWVTSKNDVCEFCQAMEGETISIEKNFFDKGDTVEGTDGSEITVDYADVGGPPLHPNCVTGDTIVVSPDAEKLTRMSYSGDIVEISLSNGRKLSVTPNHPILTSRGFISACLLKNSDKLISVADDEGIVFSNPDHNNSPAIISQVFDTLQKTSGMTTTAVPVTAKDFHGDGKSGNGNIDIISTNGLLADRIDTSFSKPVGKVFLNRAYTELSHFSGNSNLTSMLVALAATADGIVCGDHVSDILGSSSATVTCSNSLRNASNYDARLDKARSDSASVNIKALSDTVFRLSGVVSFTDIINIEVKKFHGYVYDLSTKGTVYIANGIISSNCHCGIRPVVSTMIQSSAESVSEKEIDNAILELTTLEEDGQTK